MLAFLRFVMVGAVVLTLIYAALWFRLRAEQRKRILEDWRDDPTNRRLKDYIAEETARTDRLRHRNLILLVYVLPVCTVTAIIYLTNFH